MENNNFEQQNNPQFNENQNQQTQYQQQQAQYQQPQGQQAPYGQNPYQQNPYGQNPYQQQPPYGQNPYQPYQPNPYQQYPYRPPVRDEKNLGLIIVSFLIPLVGLILYITLNDETPIKARACGKAALISFILGIVFAFLSFFLFIVAFSSAVAVI